MRTKQAPPIIRYRLKVEPHLVHVMANAPAPDRSYDMGNEWVYEYHGYSRWGDFNTAVNVYQTEGKAISRAEVHE